MLGRGAPAASDTFTVNIIATPHGILVSQGQTWLWHFLTGVLVWGTTCWHFGIGLLLNGPQTRLSLPDKNVSRTWWKYGTQQRCLPFKLNQHCNLVILLHESLDWLGSFSHQANPSHLHFGLICTLCVNHSRLDWAPLTFTFVHLAESFYPKLCMCVPWVSTYDLGVVSTLLYPLLFHKAWPSKLAELCKREESHLEKLPCLLTLLVSYQHHFWHCRAVVKLVECVSQVSTPKLKLFYY